jgi:hypothetical protein
MFGLLYHQPLSYMGYSYPTWAEWLGWGLATSSILMIPLVAIITLIRTPGTLREVKIKCFSFAIYSSCYTVENAD